MHFSNRHTIVNSGNSKSFRRSYHNSTASYNLNIVRREASRTRGRDGRRAGNRDFASACARAQAAEARGRRPGETERQPIGRGDASGYAAPAGGVAGSGTAALYIIKTITNYRIHSRSGIYMPYGLTLYYINALSLCETTGGQGAGAFMRHPPDLRASLLAARHSLAAPPRRGASVSLSVA